MTVERCDRSRVDWYGPDGSNLDCPAKVTINGKIMRIEAIWEGRRLSYGGQEVSSDFYRFTSDHDASGVAYLHRRPDNPDFLMGNWRETASRGLWTLLLDRDE